jgi:hypothetical protein
MCANWNEKPEMPTRRLSPSSPKGEADDNDANPEHELGAVLRAGH